MTIIKLILVILLIIGMAIILLGIGQLSGDGISSPRKDVDKLRDEVNNSENVITPRSAFSNFIGACRSRKIRNRI